MLFFCYQKENFTIHPSRQKKYYIALNINFSRTCRRAAYHYIKKTNKRGEDSSYSKHYILGDSP
jgi:hypothetical protein